MERAEQILSAVQSLYDGLLTARGVADALPAVCAATGGSMSLYLAAKGPTGEPPSVFSVGYDPEGILRFRDFIAHCGLPSWVRTIPVATLRRRTELVADRDFAKSDFYNEAIRPMRGFYAILAPLMGTSEQQAHLTVGRRLGEKDFSDEDIAAMQAIVPHFGNVLRLQKRLSAADFTAANAFAILDRLTTGVVVVDKAMRPVFVNARAEAIVASGALMVTRSGVMATTTAGTQALHKAIAAAFELASCVPSAGEVRRVKTEMRLHLSRPLSDLPLVIAVVPVRASDRADWCRTPWVVLFVTEPGRSHDIEPNLLTSVFDLAPREAALAVLFARGATLAEAASMLGIGIGTARWYLKRVLEKTHTHKQSDLMRVLSGFADDGA
jgi:DNA-binding CsgD family transcriptional regulator